MFFVGWYRIFCLFIPNLVPPDLYIFPGVVLDYPKAQLYHLGTRDMQTLQELDVDIGVPKPRRWTVRSRQECQSLLESFHSFAEG